MFKKVTSLFVMVAFLLACGCGSTKVIDGTEYDTRGLVHTVTDDVNPNIEYKVVWGNVIWGAIMCGTVIAPIYFYGFSMFEPVGKKKHGKLKGSVSSNTDNVELKVGNEFDRIINR